MSNSDDEIDHSQELENIADIIASSDPKFLEKCQNYQPKKFLKQKEIFYENKKIPNIEKKEIPIAVHDSIATM